MTSSSPPASSPPASSSLADQAGMTAGLRRAIGVQIAAALPPGMPLFEANDPIRGAALEQGYLRYALALDDAMLMLGPNLGPNLVPNLAPNTPRSGFVELVIAVPSGSGSAISDRIIDSLDSTLSHGGTGGLRFAGLAVMPGRLVGPLWVIDAEIGFTSWVSAPDRAARRDGATG